MNLSLGVDLNSQENSVWNDTRIAGHKWNITRIKYPTFQLPAS